MSCLYIMKKYNPLSLTIKLSGYQFSTDQVNWVDNEITLGRYNSGAYVRGTHYPCGASFEVNNEFLVSGSLSSLIDNGNGDSIFEITEPGAFSGLFRNSLITSFDSEELLPFSVLSENCFTGMFMDCHNLSLGAASTPCDLFRSVSTSAQGCCAAMFSNCNFTEIPEGMFIDFPLAENCFEKMFSGNPSLESIPGGLLLNTVEVPPYGYQEMFEGCSGLTSLPDGLLPSEYVNFRGYYGMFKNCTGLKSIPKDFLPAPIYENYAYGHMFEGCSSLTSVSKDLFKQRESFPYSAGIYAEMFKNCSSLSCIEVPFKRWPNDESTGEHDALTEWVSGVAEKGIFICPEELPKEYGVSRIPTGWKVNPGSTAFSANFLNKHKIGGRAK